MSTGHLVVQQTHFAEARRARRVDSGDSRSPRGLSGAQRVLAASCGRRLWRRTGKCALTPVRALRGPQKPAPDPENSRPDPLNANRACRGVTSLPLRFRRNAPGPPGRSCHLLAVATAWRCRIHRVSGESASSCSAPERQNRRSARWLPAVPVCAPVGIRTPNLLIRSQMLYPLSYRRPPCTPGNPGAGLVEDSRPLPAPRNHCRPAAGGARRSRRERGSGDVSARVTRVTTPGSIQYVDA